jgi:hypothetical protein
VARRVLKCSPTHYGSSFKPEKTAPNFVLPCFLQHTPNYDHPVGLTGHPLSIEITKLTKIYNGSVPVAGMKRRPSASRPERKSLQVKTEETSKSSKRGNLVNHQPCWVWLALIHQSSIKYDIIIQTRGKIGTSLTRDNT